jgi:3-oxoadipate enol-lactonase
VMPTLVPYLMPPAARSSGALRLRDAGEGEPLLLLHGLGMSGEAYRFLSPRLAERYRLIVPDLRGHGGSSHLPGPCTTEAMAADLAPALDALGITSAHILGHSHGGAVAQVFARTHPQRVRSLVLVSTYAVQRVTWWQQMVGQLSPEVITRVGTRQMAWVAHRLRPAGGGRPLNAQAAALAASMLAANDRRCLGDALLQSGQFDSRAWLHTLQIPTLVITGDADCVIVPQQAEDLARRIPGARLQMLSRAGHALPLSHPGELAQLITAWLDHVDHTASATHRVPEVA